MNRSDALATVVQFTVATAVLALPYRAGEVQFFYVHYAVGLAVLPWAVGVAAGRRLDPLRRVVLVCGIALHPLGMFTEAYFDLWWYDYVTHFVSSTLLALGIYLGLRAVRGAVADSTDTTWQLHLVALLAVAVAGVGWEIYEGYADWLVVFGAFDTAKDLVVNTVGWSVAAVTHWILLGEYPARVARRVGRPRDGTRIEGGSGSDLGSRP